MPERRTIGDAELAHDLAGQPCRADQQVGEIGEERGPAAFDEVADELADPGNHEHGEREPQQMLASERAVQPFGQQREQHEHDEHRRAERARQAPVEGQCADHHERAPQSGTPDRGRYRQQPQQCDGRPQDCRHADPVDQPVGRIAVVRAIAAEPVVDAAHARLRGLNATILRAFAAARKGRRGRQCGGTNAKGAPCGAPSMRCNSALTVAAAGSRSGC
jgi:hypothetical protein